VVSRGKKKKGGGAVYPKKPIIDADYFFVLVMVNKT
jgi:hypothetical protein